MKTNAEYKQAFELITELVSIWNLYSILEDGEPRDEFSDEVARLVGAIPRIHGPDDAAAAIACVFNRAFDTKHHAADWEAQGLELFDHLKNAGLLDGIA